MSIWGKVRRALGLEPTLRPRESTDEVGSPIDEEAYTAALLANRAEKDRFFKEDPRSPLPPDVRATFQGLAYYPPNRTLRLVLPLERDPSGERIVMQTSTGDEQVYERLGYVSFEVDGEPTRLAIYRDVRSGALFLPFRDATSGSETYGAGRYLEPVLLDDNTVLVDFNLAYNPFCAYSDQWSCPLPPMENWLRVPIRAGEKAFSAHTTQPDEV
ncbi:DUF1684 domain-containing protein [Ardenticatena maritima]|nr:DUF1684 domain-containing protein [Ardenticatena maritima]